MGSQEHDKFSKEYLHKDHKFHFPFFPEAVDSKAHVQMDTEFVSAFPDTKVVIKEIFAADDKVVLRGSLSGTQKNEFNKIPATNKKIDFPFMGIIKFKDGKNIEEWVEFDSVTMMKQLGVVKD